MFQFWPLSLSLFLRASSCAASAESCATKVGRCWVAQRSDPNDLASSHDLSARAITIGFHVAGGRRRCNRRRRCRWLRSKAGRNGKCRRARERNFRSPRARAGSASQEVGSSALLAQRVRVCYGRNKPAERYKCITFERTCERRTLLVVRLPIAIGVVVVGRFLQSHRTQLSPPRVAKLK